MAAQNTQLQNWYDYFSIHPDVYMFSFSTSTKSTISKLSKSIKLKRFVYLEFNGIVFNLRIENYQCHLNWASERASECEWFQQ